MIDADAVHQFFNKILALALVFSATVSCNNDQMPKDKYGCALPAGYERVLISPAVPYQNWQIRATGKDLTWNGTITSDLELQRFAAQLAKLPVSAGSAVFEVTKSVSCEDRTRVRTALLRSGLCKQGRCWELEGAVKAPIVYSK
jgi:hypothetical protein